MTGLVWALSLSWADPPRTGVLADARVQLTEESGIWRIQVEDRVLEVPTPTRPEDHRLVEALVTSLLTELAPVRPEPPPIRLVPVAPTAPPPVTPPAPLTQPVPSPREPPPAEPGPSPPSVSNPPVAPQPTPPTAVAAAPADGRWAVWLAPELRLRPKLRTVPGIAAGLTWGRSQGISLRAAVRWPGSTAFASDTSLRTVEAEGVAFQQLGPVHVFGGAGTSWRAYRRNTTTVATHVVPFAIIGLALPLRADAWHVGPSLGAMLDLARTEFSGPADGARLFPLGVRLDLRVGRGLAPRGPE